MRALATWLGGAAALVTVGCAPIPQPVVDLAGKDPVQANRDMASCVAEGSSKVIAFGNPVTKCMKAKGYTILVGY